jgi:hypothetical protein
MTEVESSILRVEIDQGISLMDSASLVCIIWITKVESQQTYVSPHYCHVPRPVMYVYGLVSVALASVIFLSLISASNTKLFICKLDLIRFRSSMLPRTSLIYVGAGPLLLLCYVASSLRKTRSLLFQSMGAASEGEAA